MKSIHLKLAASAILLSAVFSCKKGEVAANAVQTSTADYAVVSDSVSMAATQQVADRKFVKTADINMEVKDVYEATIFIEKQLKELGGFVTVSRLNSNVISEDTFETSDSEATLVKKYQTENRIQARVPSEKLGDFLTRINDKKMFLNSRTILAEDVTNNAKIAQLEKQKLEKTGEVIGKMKNSGDKVDRTENNLEQHNQQQIADITLADDLNYSTVDIYIKEPKIRVAEILVTNTKNIDNKYKFTFFYDAKNAFVEGFYIIQRLLVGLITIWPLMLILGFMVYFLRRKKSGLSET
ncbi:Uncharacterised protein [Chryseobacterium taklimakanense]|uniref:DUF4349 domain-containing protein n=1 Tax=Chryseobacterium taklimakanense TaxID=536441 RepID=A0A239XEH5_9FLAO|nr:DUF4349 domain-containing protein [Chryseobacterium taklimakanense]SNV44776.1 Uncharacterised protein [Chryseobacterium taklimakanense]